jgi:hypothetical protein
LQTVCGVQACCQLVQAQAQVSADQRKWLEFLDKILVDEYALEHDEQGILTAVHLLSKNERGSYRHGSATDPDASYRVHGKHKIELGYNISVAADDTYIREIRADTGATPDVVPLPELLTAQQEQHALLPARLVYDRAAGSPKTLALVDKVTAGATQLVAQLIDHSGTTPLYGPLDFSFDDDALILTCPNGKTAQTPHRSSSGDGWNFRFSRNVCADCPLLARCYKKPATQRYRTVFISDYRRIADRLRTFAQQPLYRFLLRDRSNIERIIAGLVRYNDARVARRCGLAAADFQVKMSAMAFNVKALLKRRTQLITQGEMGQLGA